MEKPFLHSYYRPKTRVRHNKLTEFLVQYYNQVVGWYPDSGIESYSGSIDLFEGKKWFLLMGIHSNWTVHEFQSVENTVCPFSLSKERSMPI